MESAETLRRWNVYPLLSKEQFQAATLAGIEPLHAQLLMNRGITSFEEMKKFIHAEYDETRDPLALIDMPRAVERIRQALEREEHITVYGDYDADGVTSSALLFRALRTLKHPQPPLDFHIPHRLRDGCGLNLSAIDQLKARGTQLIITTDCASSDVEQVAYAKAQGIDVIITDHHHPPTHRPDAYAMVNPWRPDCVYGERYLCGVGIAFKLTQALYRAYKRAREEELALLDLVAVGTIADIAPLLGENHTFVRLGMQRLNDTANPGLRALIRMANLQPGKLRERDIAFGLAPRINAAGRMQEASIAFELLTTDSQEEANALATELEQLNLLRQQETEELMKHVREQAQRYPTRSVILVSGDDWHEGIIGLVAGKLAEEINKPVLVLSNDPQTRLSRGSARSQKGFNIIEALRGFSPSFERYGGHAQAAGFTIRSELIEELYQHLLQWKENDGPPALIEGTGLPDQTGVVTEQEGDPVGAGLAPAQELSTLATSMVDITFTKMERLNYQFYKTLRQLSPFGAGNPEPTFKMEGLRLLDKWSSGLKRQNLRLRLGAARGNVQQMGTFTRQAALQQALEGITHVNIIFRVESSIDEAKQEIWLKILDMEPGHSSSESENFGTP
ncbi:MAG TPA: single-stranded-DNA-specific exonuclease RecJ [Ktedonobacteraceae bacterium]|nr:single-stranded-DNA-specific exonuclease RecJ [Ktedonobacteraceae bacterium]